MQGGGMQAIVDSVQTVFRKYATFSGRAGRAEFWWYFLFVVVVAVVLSLITWLLYVLFLLATIIPTLAVEVRRLHDTGRSGWWLLVGLVPLVGWIVLLYFYAQPGDPAANQYGQPQTAMAAA